VEKTGERIQQITMIDLNQLVPRKGNRKVGGIPKENLQELADSIKAKGVLQPLIVRLIPDAPESQKAYEIVAGERRCRAAGMAGLKTVPCQIREMDDEEADEVALIDNLHREDLHPLDEAEAFAQLLERGTDVEGIASEIGRPVAYIHQRMILRRLIPAAEKMLREGAITSGHGMAIARLSEDGQAQIVKWIQENSRWDGLPSIRKLEEYTRARILLSLSGAAFKKNDSALFPEAGACTACQKRSGYQPTLFADVGKSDMCLDATCFNKKLDLFLAQRREQLAGDDLVLVDDGHSSRPAPGTIPRWNLDPCKASESGAKKTLIVTGPDRGKIGYTLVTRSGARTSTSPAEKAKRTRELAEQRIKREVKLEIYKAVTEEAGKRLMQSEGIPVEVLRAIAGEAFDRFCERKALMKMEGWKDPSPNAYQNTGRRIFKNMDEPELLLSMLKCMIFSAFSNYSDGSDLNAAAKAYSVDVKAIEKRIRAEHASKKERGPKLAKAATAKKVKNSEKRIPKKMKS